MGKTIVLAEKQKKEQAPHGNSALADQLAKWMADQEET